MSIFKTVPVPDRGVDYQVKAHAIDPRAWRVLDGFGTRVGSIRSFKGWNSLLAESAPIVTLASKGRLVPSPREDLTDDLMMESIADVTVETQEPSPTGDLFLLASADINLEPSGGNPVIPPPVTPIGGPIIGLSEYFQPLSLTRRHIALMASAALEFDVNTGTHTDITGSSSLLASMMNPWSICVFGGEVLISSLLTDGIHKWNGTGGFTKITGAPTFAFIATLNDYLLGLYERVGTDHFPYSFRWAAEATNDKWIADDTVDAGDFDIRDSPDKGVAMYKLGDDMIIYKERTIVPVTFIGGNEIFGRRAAVAGVGLIGPYALAAAGDRHIFMGQETFYSYTGGNVVDDSIGDAIRDLVYTDINPDIKEQVRTLYLRDSLEIVWFYPSRQNLTGLGCDRAVIYNLKDGTWAGPMSIIDFITACANFTNPSPLKRDILGTKAGHISGYGSSYTENGAVQLRIMESGDHNLQTDATNETGGKVFWPLSMVFQVNVVNIDVEALFGMAQARFYIGSRLDLNDPIVWQGPYPIQASSLQTIRIPVRSTGRWFRVKIETNSTDEFALFNYQFEFEWVGGR